MINLKNKLFYILLILGLLTFSTKSKVVFAAEDDDIEEMEEIEDGDSLKEQKQKTNLYDNEKGLEGDKMYKLDSVTADTFQKISNIEKENVLMKLKIEQEKLKLEIEKQEIEKRRLKSNELDLERQRKIKIEEQERKLALEKKKTDEEVARIEAEKQEKIKQETLNKQIMDKINSADMSNSEDVKYLTQLLSMANNGKQGFSDLGSGRSKYEQDEKEVPFEEKYKLRSIIGAGGKLTANIQNLQKNISFKVKQGSFIDDWSVTDIKGTSVLLQNGKKRKVLSLN